MRLAVFASGAGTNLAAMISEGVPICLVLADRKCDALQIAESANIEVCIIDRREFGYRVGVGEAWDREGFTLAVLKVLIRERVDLVALAGFFTILHPLIFDKYRMRILNSHPALLPNFRGATAVRDALEAGVVFSGTTVHVVTEILDDDSHILAQSAVPVFNDDTVDELWDRIKVRERQLYPVVLKKVLIGEIDLSRL